MAAASIPTYDRFIALHSNEDGAAYTYPNYVDGNAQTDISYTISIYRI